MTVVINGTTGITSPEMAVDNGAADGGQVVLKSSGFNNWNIDNYSGNCRFYYNATELMRIDSSGNVGIGTSSPSYPVDVYSAASGIVRVKGGSSSGQGGAFFVGAATSGSTLSAFGDWARINGGTVDQATAVYSVSSAPMLFAVGSERMRIDTSGNVGIGVVPVAGAGKLQLNATEVIGFQASGGGNIASNLYYSGGWKYITTGTATLYSQASGAHYWSCIASGSANASASFSNAMTLDSSGNLLVGASAATGGGERLFVSASLNGTASRIYNYSGSTPQGLYIYYPSVAPNSTASQFLICGDNAADRMVVRSNGGIANFSANNVNLSDERTKTNIQDAGSYLAKICAIPVRTFKYKDQTDDLLNLGVIAQEVEVVAPELVDVSGFGETPEDGVPLKAIYQTDLQYALMKCIQEQQSLITQLQADVATLKGNA